MRLLAIMHGRVKNRVVDGDKDNKKSFFTSTLEEKQREKERENFLSEYII